MSESLFSQSWYRVASLRPRLRSHAQIHRHVYRGAIWYVLQDHATGRFHRFTPTAHAVIGLMDGERTLQQIWDLACERLGDEVLTQDEVIKLLSDLHRADVLRSDTPPDLREQQERRGKHLRAQLLQYLGNPMSIRFPVLDPDRALQALVPFLRPFFGWFGLLLWCGLVGWALVLGGMHWNELSRGIEDRVFSSDNLLLLWLVFPLLKILHELGHGLAVRVRGGEVHEMGVMFLLFVPIPYVDASSASAFPDKRWRMLVGAAGMLTEVLVAALAMILWTFLEPGPARAVAYNVVLIAGVTTVLFNGNPFLRYDGYYILSDFLEIPNLAQRANEYLGYLINRHVFRVDKVNSPVSAPGEARWFVFYSVVSFVYRMLMMVAIVLIMAGQFFVVGVLMAVWAIYSMLLQPALRKLDYLFNSPRLERRRRRALLATGSTLAVLMLLVLALPVPSFTRAEGVVWVPDEAQVRARVDGFITRVEAGSGQQVARDDLLILCSDPELATRVAALQAELIRLEARYVAAVATNRVQAEILQQQVVHARYALDLSRRRLAETAVRSPLDGTFIVVDAPNLPGRFAHRGDLLAYVVPDAATTVRVVVSQADADQVRQRVHSVSVRSVDRVGAVLPARVLREVPAATDQLPGMALSLQGGGKIGLDPSQEGDARALHKQFVFDLQLNGGDRLGNLGSRVYVRFEHPAEPLAQQWMRTVRTLFLKKFNV
jgi:putative peptide zinc metalloprotease protein